MRAAGGGGFAKICAAVSVNPIVSISGIRNRSSKRRSESGDNGAEAERPKRNAENARGLVCGSGARGGRSSSRATIVGTTLNQEQRRSAIKRQKSSARNLSGITTDPPASSGAKTVTHKPLMWQSGNEQSARSAARSWCAKTVFAAPASKLECVCKTPFGRPVVPLV